MPKFANAGALRKTMSSLTLILLCLAVYRIAHMIAREEGPFSIFQRMREPFANQATWFGRGLHCVLCLSYWIGLVVAAFLPWPVEKGWMGLFWFLLYWHSIAGGVLIAHKVFK